MILRIFAGKDTTPVVALMMRLVDIDKVVALLTIIAVANLFVEQRIVGLDLILQSQAKNVVIRQVQCDF